MPIVHITNQSENVFLLSRVVASKSLASIQETLINAKARISENVFASL